MRIQIARLRMRASLRGAFTLVEVLIVLFIFMILAAIALPSVRGLLDDQKITSATRGLAAFIDVTRSRAIAEGRTAGIVIERAGPLADTIGSAASIRVRQATGVPPYTGEASNSVALIQPGGLTAEFNARDNQLLALSASLVGTADEIHAPIRSGDFIELPGGRIAPFTIDFRASTAPDTVPVVINLNLPEQFSGTRQFPSAAGAALTGIPSGGRPVKYKIYRRPTISSSATYSLPRGVAIDLNYSGMGQTGNEFAPDVVAAPMPMDPPVVANAEDISILFGSDGKVALVTDSNGVNLAPTGLIFLCVGRSEGVRPDELFAVEEGATATLMDLDTTWLVINPSTGRVVATPIAAVSMTPSTATRHDDPNPDSTLFPMPAARTAEQNLIDTLIRESRAFALLSDTLDS